MPGNRTPLSKSHINKYNLGMVLIKKFFFIIFLSIFLQNCSTAIKVVDTTASTVVSVVSNTIHFTTCPITKKNALIIYKFS
jgi:hypothetical protein